MQPVPPSGERSNREIQLDSKKRFKSQLDAENWAHRLPMVLLALRTLHCDEFDVSSAMTLYEFAASQPVLPDGQRMADDPQAALQRHQHRVASYQYVPTRFPVNQKVHVNKRLLTR